MEKALVKKMEQELDAEFLPDTKTHKNRIKIPSETSNNLYIVSQTKLNGIWQCACFGFRRHRNCKHLKAIVPLIESASKATKVTKKTKLAPPTSERVLKGKYKKAIEVLLKYDFGWDLNMTQISQKFETVIVAETFDQNPKQVAKDIKSEQKKAKKKGQKKQLG